MSKTDWVSAAVTLILAGALWFVGGPKAALACIFLGILIILVVHFKKPKEKTSSANGIIKTYSEQSAPTRASTKPMDAGLDLVVTRGPRLEVRFIPDTEPYRFVGPLHDTTHYRIGVYNDGPGTADNLQIWLIGITPRPSSPLFHADFPYAVRWAQGNVKDNIGYRLNPRSEIHYEFLSWWISASDQLYVDGIDTKHDPRDARFPMQENESWRMEYEVTCANSGPERVAFLVRREGQQVFVLRLDSTQSSEDSTGLRLTIM